MGHRYFFGTQEIRLAQTCLFAACVLFCLRPGDSLECKHCASWSPDQPCEPVESTCNSVGENPVCMTSKVYLEDTLNKKFMGCFDDNAEHKACGNTGSFPEVNLNYENVCCSDGDFCNNDM